jgi:hypothetical protein
MDNIEEVSEKSVRPTGRNVGESSTKNPIKEESKEPSTISSTVPRTRQTSGEAPSAPTTAAIPIQYQTMSPPLEVTDCRSLAVAEFNARGRSGTNVRSDAVITGIPPLLSFDQ